MSWSAVIKHRQMTTAFKQPRHIHHLRLRKPAMVIQTSPLDFVSQFSTSFYKAVNQNLEQKILDWMLHQSYIPLGTLWSTTVFLLLSLLACTMLASDIYIHTEQCHTQEIHHAREKTTQWTKKICKMNYTWHFIHQRFINRIMYRIQTRQKPRNQG